jgi:protein AATF/BFR2
MNGSNHENGTAYSSSESDEGHGPESEDDEDDEMHSVSDMRSNSDFGDDSELETVPSDDRRSEAVSSKLQELMAQDQEIVSTSLSQAAKSDIEKGKAIKEQRSTFDALLNVRVKLQKALISTNSLALSTDDADVDAIRAAEEAAVKLLDNIDNLRSTLQSSKTGEKRKRSKIQDKSVHDIWSELTAAEAVAKRQRNSTLDSWATKTRAANNIVQKRNLEAASGQQSLSDVLSGYMMDMPRLVAKTELPRSCAPLQATRNSKPSEETERPSLPIYDDADFYGLLLQNLISQRSSESDSIAALNVSFATQPWQAAREAKTKKAVDTKASKGRRLRYTVHENLQDTMPRDDRTTWTERQCDELFASILGRKIQLQDEGDTELEDGAAGLRLFA